jgi:hypothetical protein
MESDRKQKARLFTEGAFSVKMTDRGKCHNKSFKKLIQKVNTKQKSI